MACNIVLVDDHTLFLKGLRAILEQEKDLTVIAEAHNGKEAIQKVAELAPDFIVMDINMPEMNGIEATREIKKLSPETQVLAVSINSGKRFIKNMLDAGASGYLLKDSTPDELVTAIEKIRGGDMYLSSQVTKIALSPEKRPEAAPEIMETLLESPYLSANLIFREDLISKLDVNFPKSLTLISGPAGYGKSMLAAQWIENKRLPHAWISLTEDQNDLKTFFWYVFQALNRIFPGRLPRLEKELLASPNPGFKTLNYIFSNELNQLEQDFLLVLDNFHFIQNEQVLNIINNLLMYPPSHFHLLIITRRDPSLKLSTLRSLNKITEIRVADLSFSKTEIADLYNKLLDIELETRSIETLKNITEGWVVGLRMLSTLVEDKTKADHMLQHINQSFYMVSDYLLSEIFEKQSEETQHILLKLSLLPRFNRSLIDDLFSPLQLKKSASGEALINRFLRSNLFVVPLDKANQWVRFHRQFKQILLERLNATFSPEKIEELLQMYREWFNSKGYTEEAKSIQKTASETEMPKGSTVEPSVKTSRSPEKKLVEPLSIREQEILELVAQGMRNKEIAEKLFVSSETVKKHLYHMFQKLGVKSRVQMINKAKEMDLITP